MPIAAVTMVYNEPAFLPLWRRHYARHLGAEHCYVIDHGSDDGSTADLRPSGHIPLPRSPFDDPQRARFVSRFTAALLEWYDAVLYTDVDEILIPDPRHFPTFEALAAACPEPVLWTVGLELHQHADDPPLDPARPLGPQRRFVRFNPAMCKPLFTRRPLTYAPGFHAALGERPRFAPLYLIHLHWVDRGLGAARLAKTRTMPWRDPKAGAWQRLPEEENAALYALFASLPVEPAVDLHPDLPPLAPLLGELAEGARTPDETNPYAFPLDRQPGVLWELPARLRAALP